MTIFIKKLKNIGNNLLKLKRAPMLHVIILIQFPKKISIVLILNIVIASLLKDIKKIILHSLDKSINRIDPYYKLLIILNH